MNPIRLGLIGIGNIGAHHAEYLLAGKVNRCQLVGVCARSQDKLAKYAQRGLKTFTDAEKFLKSGEIDAVIIATPHYRHTTLGIAALEAGLHVMIEKPISAHKADAERLIACAKKHPKQIFAGMFQMRVEPRYAKIRQMIESGELGPIVRINWIIT